MPLSINCVLIGSRSRQCVISPGAAVLLITPCLLKRKKNIKLKEEYPFLKEYCHSQVLQQKVMDLYEAFKKFFKGNGGYPKFKKRHSDDGFCYPQGFKVEEDNGRIFLPKIGYIKIPQFKKDRRNT